MTGGWSSAADDAVVEEDEDDEDGGGGGGQGKVVRLSADPLSLIKISEIDIDCA